MSRPKSKVVDGSRSLQSTPRVKVKKTKMRSKESRESEHLYGSIAKSLIHENSMNSKHDTEIFVRGLINKLFTEFKQEMVAMDVVTSSRIQQIETKVNALATHIDHTNSTFEQKLNTLATNINKIDTDCRASLEGERTKRLVLTKKCQSVQAKEEKAVEELRVLIHTTNDETKRGLTSLSDDLRIQSKEIAVMKENIDEKLLKRYGFVPTSHPSVDNMTASFNQGLDAGTVLDNLTSRIKDLEIQVASVESNEHNGMHHGHDNQQHEYTYQQTLQRKGSRMSIGSVQPYSLSRNSSFNNLNGNGSNNGNSINVNQFQLSRLEECVSDMRVQVKDCENEVLTMKATLKTYIRNNKHSQSSESLLDNTGNSPRRNNMQYNHRGSGGGGSDGETAEEIRAIQRKMKKLAENTTRACRSLSSGLNEVQQATLNLYSWSDKAHEAIGTLGSKLNFVVNLCPRAKVYNPPREQIAAEGINL